MEIFKCKYLEHENEEIIGFCLNQNCQNATQYCYECLNTTHSEHFKDCIRFTKMIQFINEFMQAQIESKKQFKEISKQLQNCFEQIQKKMDQDIKILENMIQQLSNKDYLKFKPQIHIIKQFYSKEKENNRFQILQLNNVFDTIKDIVLKQSQEEDQINSVPQQVIKIVESNQVSDDQQRQNIQEVERIVQEGIALSIHLYCFWIVHNLQKYQEAIECYDIAISINPKHDSAWYTKGLALSIHLYCFWIVHHLQKYQEAIECYDIAISINPKNDLAWYNKGLALSIHLYCFWIVHHLQKYQEAFECYDEAISINPKDDHAWNNKGLALTFYYNYNLLHKLQKYKDAILCFDQALSICINPIGLKLKADSLKLLNRILKLLELGTKNEAQQFYLAALEKGYSDKQLIQKQLSKL